MTGADDNGWAVFNPHDKPLADLPVIYGFNNGGSPGWWSACLIASDGAGLGGHICSHPAFMPGDLGILEGSRPDRHEGFREHFPDGYRMEMVEGDVRSHAGLMAAYAKNQENGEASAAITRPAATRPSSADVVSTQAASLPKNTEQR